MAVDGTTGASWNPNSATLNGTRPPDAAHSGPVGGATTPELIGRIINDASDLIDRQVELAKQEVKDDIGKVAGGAKRLAIGAGVAAAMGLLLVIWLWTAFIWFFNWLGALISPWLSGIGWLIGLVIPLAVAFFAWKKFIQPGIQQVKISPLARTRATLKEDLEWLQKLRTPSGR